MQLGKLGVWAGLDGMTAANALAFAQRTEGRGFGGRGDTEPLRRARIVGAGIEQVPSTLALKRLCRQRPGRRETVNVEQRA